MFSKFAKWLSHWTGQSITFAFAILLVFLWLVIGYFYDFNSDWLSVMHTAIVIVTFLMIFLLQNTQNRDTMAIQLKLDEIIRATKGSHNELVKVEQLSDDELEKLFKRYKLLAKKVKQKINKGEGDQDFLEVKKLDDPG